MVYCISDIHGEFDRYLDMLKLICLEPEDTLYVLGDCIDRFPNGVDVLEDMMTRPNVRLIRGNHEEMCLAALGPDNMLGARQLWQSNGGSATRRDLLYRRGSAERAAILRYLRAAPDHVDVEVKGRRFHLVHGFPGADSHTRLWGRPEANTPAPIPGVTVIVGHTPTAYLQNLPGQPLRIWHGDGIIDIDCGCGNHTDLRRLACLRLDDMKEFYI